MIVLPGDCSDVEVPRGGVMFAVWRGCDRLTPRYPTDPPIDPVAMEVTAGSSSVLLILDCTGGTYTPRKGC